MLLRAAILMLACATAVNADDLPETMPYAEWRSHFPGHHGTLLGINERASAFNNTLSFIIKHNEEADAGLHSYRCGVNQFSDLWPSEYRTIYLSGLRNHSINATTGNHKRNALWLEEVEIADTVDWREKGAVTPVKDQVGTNCLGPGIL